MMKVELRNDSVLIDGYVNAVERDSHVLRSKGDAFVERISAGVFQRALDRAKRTGYDVKVLLNHDYSRQLTTANTEGTKIYEDSIGLRCICEVRDKEVIEKARAGKLSGWSFGFICIKDERKTDESGLEHRDVRELELREVSILDDTKIPAYSGTSIETRSDVLEDVIELRLLNDEVELTEIKEEFNNYEFENRYMMTKIY